MSDIVLTVASTPNFLEKGGALYTMALPLI
jgi:thiol:disulfide interchange protein